MNLTFTNIAGFCGDIDLAQPQPSVNMGTVTFIEPFALIYLGMFLRYHNRHGLYFRVSLPSSPQVRSYLSNQNFWERFNIATVPDGALVRRFNGSTSFNDIIDIEDGYYVAEDIGLKVFQLLRRNPIGAKARQVEVSISELVDNFSQHSEEQLAACAVQWYPNRERLVFAIGDCGIGIRRSLSKNERFRDVLGKDHREAAIKALEPGVGRRMEGGMGLFRGK